MITCSEKSARPEVSERVKEFVSHLLAVWHDKSLHLAEFILCRCGWRKG